MDKEGHFRMTNGSIYQEDIAILNVHIPNSSFKKKKTKNYPKKPPKTLKELKGETGLQLQLGALTDNS